MKLKWTSAIRDKVEIIQKILEGNTISITDVYRIGLYVSNISKDIDELHYRYEFISYNQYKLLMKWFHDYEWKIYKIIQDDIYEPYILKFNK